MVMRTRRVIVNAVVIAATLAVVVGVYVLGRGGRPKTGWHPREATAVRALMTGMVIYAQNNRDAFPPPERISELLVKPGIVPEEIFESPRSAPKEPAFYAVVAADQATRWSNSFKKCVPVVYVNPASFKGKRTAVMFSDGHMDWLDIAELEGLIKDSGGQSVEVR
jgi:hypothetical protein